MTLRDVLRRLDPHRKAAETVHGGGAELDAATRARTRQATGTSLEDVRVHTDDAAAHAAEEIDADAYTLGRHIVFAPGQFAPQTPHGQRLLAHELTHVLQLRTPAGQGTLRVTDPAEPIEQQAAASGASSAGPVIARSARLRPFVAAQVRAVTAALAAGNLAPGAGSAFWILNGLSPDDLVDTLRALSSAQRVDLLDHIEEARGVFDAARLRTALETATTAPAARAKKAVASLDAVRNENPPSATRRDFERALASRDWRAAFITLNGLNMYEMLAALDSMPRALLAELWTHRAEVTGVVNLERITYAHDVVLGPGLPAMTPGDLAATGQRRTASQFVAVRLLPVAAAVNGSALPHLTRILGACAEAGIADLSHVAYMLASAHHESAMGRLMTELASGEAFENRTDLGNHLPGDGPRFKGRGYVQITGRGHYHTFGTLIGVDLENHPDRAAEPEIAARIVTMGMRDGRFTGQSLADFGSDGSYDFVNARRIVNALDRAAEIAAIARRYRQALER
jgi:Domain of unknown function (DUF4157)